MSKLIIKKESAVLDYCTMNNFSLFKKTNGKEYIDLTNEEIFTKKLKWYDFKPINNFKSESTYLIVDWSNMSVLIQGSLKHIWEVLNA